MKGNIKMDHKAIGWEGMNLIHLAKDKDQWLACVKMVINLQVP
jgi:hypothetical protein